MSVVNFVIIGIAVMLLMALAVVMFVLLYQRRAIQHQLDLKVRDDQKQLELLQASLQSEEQERQRIAGELHDDVGATLSSVRLFLYKVSGSPDATDMLQQSRELLDESIRKVRDISHKLQPAALQSLGLYASLQALADMLNRSNQVKVTFQVSDGLPRIPGQAELHTYRIVQELLNNTIKHAVPTEMVISAFCTGPCLDVTIKHNGTGIDNKSLPELSAKKGAIGLKNIANRLQFIHGTIDFSRRVSYYEVRVRIPLNK